MAHAPLRRPTPRLSDRSGHAWGKIRKRILRRDPLCVYCKAKGRVSASVEVDHIVPLAQGGTDDDENLCGTCHSCHAEKSARERGARPKRAVSIDGVPEGWK